MNIFNLVEIKKAMPSFDVPDEVPEQKDPVVPNPAAEPNPDSDFLIFSRPSQLFDQRIISLLRWYVGNKRSLMELRDMNQFLYTLVINSFLLSDLQDKNENYLNLLKEAFLKTGDAHQIINLMKAANIQHNAQVDKQSSVLMFTSLCESYNLIEDPRVANREVYAHALCGFVAYLLYVGHISEESASDFIKMCETWMVSAHPVLIHHNAICVELQAHIAMKLIHL